jgi:hypothetical protein
MGLYERERVMDLRAAAAVSLSRDDLRYRVGDPSRSWLIDLGDEDIGGSLIGEDIGQTNRGGLSLVDECYTKIRQVERHHW